MRMRIDDNSYFSISVFNGIRTPRVQISCTNLQVPAPMKVDSGLVIVSHSTSRWDQLLPHFTVSSNAVTVLCRVNAVIVNLTSMSGYPTYRASGITSELPVIQAHRRFGDSSGPDSDRNTHVENA